MAPAKIKNANSEEEKAQKRAKLAQRTREKRNNLNEEQKAQERENAKVRSRVKRAILNEEQKAQEREKEKARVREKRSILNEEQKAQEREKAKARSRVKRANLNEEKKAQEREKAKNRAREKRANLNEEQKAEERQKAKKRTKEKRANLNKENKSKDRERNGRNMIKTRENKQDKTRNIARILKSDPIMVPQFILGPMTIKCKGCGSLNFESECPPGELFTYCCHKGKVQLNSSVYPETLKKLMTTNNAKSEWPTANHQKNFMENIRTFNSALAFASMGGPYLNKKGDRGIPIGGIFCFKVCGQIYHVTSKNIHPKEGEPRKYAQLYMLDPEEACQQRMNDERNKNCNKMTMQKLSTFMETENILAKSYKMMQEVEKSLTKDGKELPSLTLSFRENSKIDKRRYNAPTANEIAVVFHNTDGEPPWDRDIRVYNKNACKETTTQINILHPKCDPMLYPILYPYGENGWHPGLKITQMQYYAHIFATRDNFNPFLYAGKLTQQFVVDAHVKTEANRLHFIRTNQPKLRVEKYSGLMDHLHQREKNNETKLGIPVILPSSFQGSARNMQQRYQDAMAVVRKFGKPDYFVTMTCNPKWIAITENLNGCIAPNRPDLIVKVFNSKLKEFMKDLKEKRILGKIRAMVYVIEFQKRGLPHAHILIIVDEDDKPRTQEDIDKIVWAEIPDKVKHPELYEVVVKHMIHGPCGSDNPNSPCMENGKCKKEFPKDFQDETLTNCNGYPKYQRRRGQTYNINTKTINNSWVVPYNPYILQKYNCHINVEVCASVKSVKYLYKYVFKGYDCANLEIVHDEVQTFLDSRYISPPEAMWRMNGYLMHWQSHNIIRLAVHLPKEQSVVFLEGMERAAADNVKDTTLLAWFKLNKTSGSVDTVSKTFDKNQNIVDGDAFDENIEIGEEIINETTMNDSEESVKEHNNIKLQDLLYTEIPQNYVFHKGEWKRRQRRGEQAISRMYTVGMNDPERFYLRLLLLHVRGATSFEYLRTVDDVLHLTFQDACRARRLLADDTEWDNALNEAGLLQSAKAVRLTFAMICAFGNPSDIHKLWEKHKSSMIEDFEHHNESGPENRALLDIESIVRQHSIDYSKLGLPTTNAVLESNSEFDPEVERQNGEISVSKLNTEQKHVFNMVMKAIDDPDETKRCFFVDGPGGSGKTFLYNTLLSVLRGRGEKVLPVASTGIAATLLEGGTTYHSQFKIPVPLQPTSSCGIRMKSDQAEAIRSAKLIVWDEAGMTPGLALQKVNDLLKEIFNSKKVFGNMVILFGGDFRQTLPIVPHGSRVQIIEESMKRSILWQHITQVHLTQNMRTKKDKEFADWLIQLGDGSLTNTNNIGEDIIELPHKFLSDVSIINEIFAKNFTASEAENFANRAILCPVNMDTLKLNDEVLHRLEGEEKVYHSIDSIVTDDEQEKLNYPTEFLNTITPGGMPVHALKLKVGAIIMLLRNLCKKRALCNGTRLIVTKMMKNVIFAKVLTGRSAGQYLAIPRIELAPSDVNWPFTIKRRQFPIRVSFVMTINKSQGQTLDKVGLYLPQPVFSHGQLYVAFSRVTSSSNIKVKVNDTKEQGNLIEGSDKVFTRNVVYKEVL